MIYNITFINRCYFDSIADFQIFNFWLLRLSSIGKGWHDVLTVYMGVAISAPSYFVFAAAFGFWLNMTNIESICRTLVEFFCDGNLK
jgi:hypothetical protein